MESMIFRKRGEILIYRKAQEGDYGIWKETWYEEEQRKETIRYINTEKGNYGIQKDREERL